MKDTEFDDSQWKYKLALTDIPIEIDGVLYKARAIPHPNVIEAMAGEMVLGLEKIEKKPMFSVGDAAP